MRGGQGNLCLLEWAQLPMSSLEGFLAKVSAQNELFRKSEPLPGVTELLMNLTKRTLPPIYTALATSSGVETFHIKTGHLPVITAAFPETCRVCGDDAAMADREGKPAPDIFLLALQRINETLSPQEKLIAPEECLVFEDSIAGVEAGRRACMRVVWVPHPGLLEVCRGREEMVLTGNTEQAWNELGETGQEQEQEQEQRGKPQGKVGIGRSWKSKDGWAEMRTSLRGFPYESYGIHIRPLDR